MEPPAGGSADHRGASASAAPSGLRRYGLSFSASSLLQAPLAALLEYSGIVPSGPAPQMVQPTVPSSSSSEADGLLSAAAAGDGEVSIRIQSGPGDTDATETASSPVDSIEATAASDVDPASAAGRGGGADAEASGGGSGGATGNGAGGRAYQRYDVHHVARWIEQILPFSLLLLVVFIRQHLQGFFVTIWIAAVMFKSNDILWKQTALKGERKIVMLVGITVIFMIHVFGVYWWYRNDDLLRPLFMLPPKDIPPFWHAIFIIMVNDTMVRQAAMAVKCMLLIYYKNSRGRNYRRQGYHAEQNFHVLEQLAVSPKMLVFPWQLGGKNLAAKVRAPPPPFLAATAGTRSLAIRTRQRQLHGVVPSLEVLSWLPVESTGVGSEAWWQHGIGVSAQGVGPLEAQCTSLHALDDAPSSVLAWFCLYSPSRTGLLSDLSPLLGIWWRLAGAVVVVLWGVGQLS